MISLISTTALTALLWNSNPAVSEASLPTPRLASEVRVNETPIPRLAPGRGPLTPPLGLADLAASVPAPRLAPERPAGAAQPAWARQAATVEFDAQRAPFTITVRNDLEIDFRIFALFAEPGETLTLQADQPVSWVAGDAAGEAQTDHAWTAPETPGVHEVVLRDAAGGEMQLNLVVMHRFNPEAADALNGYRIGTYPSRPYRGLDAYRAPDHFVAAPAGLEDLQVAPHFRLGQFLCKQEADGEPYLVLSERLLAKLELILEAANDRGWPADTFHVMSGYRTPAYNASIGNGEYSRHVYGGAADIFIDEDGDGRMDDLNGDGQVTRDDAGLLYELVESLSGLPHFAPYVGGLGEYGPNAVRGPFVHVDERGFRARWGRISG